MRRLRSVIVVLATPLVALLCSLVIGALIIIFSGASPIDTYAALFQGAFGSWEALGHTIENATPLILTGLAVAFAFRGGLFNIGADGQFYAGAVTAAWAGVVLRLPAPGGLVLALLAGALAGGALGALAGYLKAAFGAHEVVTTIMLNFIMIDLANWLLLGPLSAHAQVPGSALISAANQLPALSANLGGAHWGFVVSLLAAVSCYVVLWRTPLGMDVRMAGLAPRAARYSGMRPIVGAVLSLGIGGIFGGLAGAGEVLGTYGHMTVPFVTNLGFLGIGVALLGRNHPLGCVVGGLILGGLAAGGQQLQFQVGLSAHLADILIGVILLLVTAQTFGVRWRRARRAQGASRSPSTDVDVVQGDRVVS